MKKGFSLMELIFAIVIIGIIASFAIPKYMQTRTDAMASTIQRDVVTSITSLQSYYLVNRDIEKISDVITLNTKNWTVEDKKITYVEDNTNCVVLSIGDKELNLTVTQTAGDVCEELVSRGITTETIDLI